MDQITDLRQLLKHELKDLYSAEVQIIEAMPAMIETAQNPQLKKALSDHLKVTRDQKKRLEEIQEILNIENETSDENGGFFANLFKSKEGEQHCKAMEGIIKEGNAVMSEDMTPEVMDAAIIMAAQKIEHYEISSYGTAKAYALQLGLSKVEKLLNDTLNEEYFADDSLTALAVNKVNIVAESAEGNNNGKSAGKNNNASVSNQSGRSTGTKAAKKAAPKKAVKSASPQKAAAKKSSPKKAAPNKGAAKKGAPKKAAPKKAIPNRGAAKKAAPKKATAKKAAPNKGMAKKAAPKKAAPKKAAPNRGTAKKAAPKKGAAKKAAPNRGMAKKAAPKKGAAKKAAPARGAAKKSAQKKGARRR